MHKELIEHIVKKLVEKPELVSVKQTYNDAREVLEITVDEKDRGRVIGKEGKTIRALRMLMNAVTAPGKEVQVIITDN